MRNLCSVECFLLCSFLFAVLVSSKYHGNPANDLVDIINKNRTAAKLSRLSDNAGLGCMALQFINFCKGNCSSNNTVNCNPSSDNFTEVFAPDCGVELPTFDTITGQIVACQPGYLEPTEAFSRALVPDKKTLSLLRNKSHTEVGVGMVGVHKGPFFWCVLFSNGKTNSTFVLENHGLGIKQKRGCFSGSGVECSRGHSNGAIWNNVSFTLFFLIIYCKICSSFSYRSIEILF
ncbi:uncharacterized protein LOC111807547 [Cucurbita pepo subsp. pepo]|uniref:uncharacterized protein LOC111807547 n=1 Tax=Cucurbita pepo subsp. pepo TaxID=3664 RepID=UPI000C9DA037|nr:uncharacterized protein LOC111807547 [Cucurbita pepo subsp. pepo]